MVAFGFTRGGTFPPRIARARVGPYNLNSRALSEGAMTTRTLGIIALVLGIVTFVAVAYVSREPKCLVSPNIRGVRIGVAHVRCEPLSTNR